MIDYSTKVISPTDITDEMLISSTAPETDYAAWAAPTNYVLGQKCIRVGTHRIYERLVAGASADVPELDTTHWADVGPMNRWAMFDDVVGTLTSTPSPLTAVISPGSVSGVALLELVGRSVTVSLKTEIGGATAYNKTIDLDGTIIRSFYEWFYQPFVQETVVVLTDLPFHYTNCELTITISATSGNASCGICKFGDVVLLGSTQPGATSGIVDYSVKTADSFGRYSIVKRSYSKRMNLKVMTEKSDYNRISRELANLRATPAIWIATERYGYEPLTVYGFYRDFSIDVAYATLNYCSIDIEGLI